MAAHNQTSTTSLARYAIAKTPGEDLYNGSTSRDFCNSFWGVGDAGPNVLFARMRGAAKLTDELRNFWNERCSIEEEYASRLAKLARAPLGADEIGELRSSIDTLRLETEKQSIGHRELANLIRSELEMPTAQFHMKQVAHRRTFQANLEKKFKAKQTQEAYVTKAREKYETDCLRINSYTSQASFMQGKDLERIQMKLQRTRQTVQANERDLANFTTTLLDMLREWEADWKEFCDTCQDLEEDRIEFMKDTLWSYANDVSTICVDDDLSCERIRTALDQLEPERDVENFVREYGTGNAIPEPLEFNPENGGQAASIPSTRPAEFIRETRRIPPSPSDAALLSNPNHDQDTQSQYQQPVENTSHSNQLPNGGNEPHVNGGGHRSRPSVSQPQTQPPSHPPPAAPHLQSNGPAHGPQRNPSLSRRRTQRQSQPLPVPGRQNQNQRSNHVADPTPPPLPEQNGSQILFYVKALYDYTATMQEEFDFQAGDVIAVTATPDDGWWSGELLDEARREPGRHVFPSNFVILF